MNYLQLLFKNCRQFFFTINYKTNILQNAYLQLIYITKRSLLLPWMQGEQCVLVKVIHRNLQVDT